jgi:hypothetical protein
MNFLSVSRSSGLVRRINEYHHMDMMPTSDRVLLCNIRKRAEIVLLSILFLVIIFNGNNTGQVRKPWDIN